MRKRATIGIFGAAAALLALVLLFVLIPRKIAPGVYINNISASGMTASRFRAEFAKIASETNKTGKLALAVRGGQKPGVSATFSELGITYDPGPAIKKALKVRQRAGRTDLFCDYVFDRAALTALIDRFAAEVSVPAVEPTIVPDADGKSATVTTGRNGKQPDKEDTFKKAEEMIRSGTGGTLQCDLIPVPPAVSTPQQLMTLTERLPRDATYSVRSNRTLEIKESEIGWHAADPAAALAGFESAVLSGEGATVRIGIVPIDPAVTGDALRSRIFKDTLSEFSSEYFTSDEENSKNRESNIKLSMRSIDGWILSPGEVFSFNDCVGERSEKTGYKIATVYNEGELNYDYGGGVCQVSGTLFNAALLAGMDVTERVNHTFMVGYLMPGFDATVSYGWLDLKFRNTSAWPVKLKADTSVSGKVTFTIKGTAGDAVQKFIPSYEVLETVPFKIVYKEDKSLPPGTEKVVQQGMNGFLIESWLTVAKPDGGSARKRLYKSRYKPMDRIILKGPAQ